MTRASALHRLRLLGALAVAAVCWPGAPAGRGAPDAGAAGAWQKLRKLPTIASALHTTAHPDDEHGGVLALLSRGDGARVSMLTLTRGESGDNAIGPELFDALALIRTEELRLAGRYYGIDQQYFASVVDYGFSKRLDEALEKWGREEVLRDMVGVIRTERPLVVISRFQGNARDGHGNHAAAGLLTPEAFRLAGDAGAFPEQIASGLRPWRPLKLYIGGVRADEDWTVRVDAGRYDPVLGDSYQTVARRGLSFQRSQNGGRFNPQPGPAPFHYTRLQPAAEGREQSFFDGIDVTIPGLFRTLGRPAPGGADALLSAVNGHIRAALDAFDFRDPSRSAVPLAEALSATRAALAAVAGDEDAVLVLQRKARQIEEALAAVLGIDVTAVAYPAGVRQPSGPAGAGPVAMEPVVPGQPFEVRTTFVTRAPLELHGTRVVLQGTSEPAWPISGGTAERTARPNEPLGATFTVTVPAEAPSTRPHFSRGSIREARYTVAADARRYRPWPEPPLDAVARFTVGGVPVHIHRPVTRFEADLPYGHHPRELTVVPAIAVTVSPHHAVTPIASPSRPVRLNVDVLNNRHGESSGSVRLTVPEGWTASPIAHAFRFGRAGERARVTFEVTAGPLEQREYRIEAVASSDGREYREGYTTIRHRDLETRELYRDAVATVRGVDVTLAAGLAVGYVMGVGDDVPAALTQLGASVELLDEQDLAASDLGRFDAILTGTRAYAVREDLRTYNQRLLEYVRDGGNLIVLYNTQELVPAVHAPHPGELPRSAEEVSEEDSPVEVVAPDHGVLTFPNRITDADFEGWVEQRGSKFWSSWDPRYTAVIATWDRGQPPQRGGWLHTRHGKGHYTYFAYALHRQLPYGVPGAYRLLANLLSLGQGPVK